MRIHIGSDHAGLEFKNELIEHLVAGGHDVTDHGPYEYDALDDYPAFCINAAAAVAADQAAGVDALGIVFGGSGNGEQTLEVICETKDQCGSNCAEWTPATEDQSCECDKALTSSHLFAK